MNSLDSIDMRVHQARTLLDNREISSVELTQAILDRIDLTDDRIQAFVTVTSDFALAQARCADEKIAAGERFPLTGIPIQLKDNMCTKDVRTTCSSRMLKEFVPPYNATVANRLYAQGAVLVG